MTKKSSKKDKGKGLLEALEKHPTKKKSGVGDIPHERRGAGVVIREPQEQEIQ